jgi:cephalosporin hydroxylase
MVELKPVGTFRQFATYDDIIIAQTPKALNLLSNIIGDFDVIIEIGYDRGGLTQWFADYKKSAAKILSFDISDISRLSQNYVFNPEIQFILDNCFSEKSVGIIKNEIESGGRTLIFCDGGDKNQEFNFFSKYLKIGDVIMLHDYYDETSDESYGSYAEGWDSGYESSYNNIKSSVKDQHLKGYYYDEFRKCLIGSYIKVN